MSHQADPHGTAMVAGTLGYREEGLGLGRGGLLLSDSSLPVNAHLQDERWRGRVPKAQDYQGGYWDSHP